MSKTINTPAAIAYFSTFELGTLNRELAIREVDEADSVKTAAVIIASSIRTLDELTAMTVNLCDGDVVRGDLERAMTECFPEHTISERHVGHYLSLARKGNLSGSVECRFSPAKAARKGRSKFKVTIDIRELTDEQREALTKAGIDLPEVVEAPAE